MSVSRITLVKGDRCAVLQGMRHVAPRKFYRRVQAELNELSANGYQVFFEGVRKSNDCSLYVNENQRRVAQGFHWLLSLYPHLARKFGMVQQQKHIKYPKDAINADCTFPEMIIEIDESGFDSERILKMISLIPEEIRLEVLEGLASDKKPPKNKHKLSRVRSFLQRVGHFIGTVFFLPILTMPLYLIFRPVKRVVLGFRNRRALEIINQYEPRKLWLCYGERHISGLVKLFKQQGWQVTDRQRIWLPPLKEK